MSRSDVAFIIGCLMGLIAGLSVGHGRGYIAGVRWCTKRLVDTQDTGEKSR